MIRKASITGAATCLVLVFAPGCGDDDDESASQKPKEGAAPKQLVGEYAMTLQRDDLPPNPPPELADGIGKWTLKIANTGGPDNGPALTLTSEEHGVLESSRLGVIGQRILLHDQDCAATAPELVESEFTYTLKAETLTFAGGKGACPDKVALTLLTANPWKRKG